MAKAQVKHEATVGVAEHGNSAVLVTVAPGGELLDRRRIDLTNGLPTHPKVMLAVAVPRIIVEDVRLSE